MATVVVEEANWKSEDGWHENVASAKIYSSLQNQLRLFRVHIQSLKAAALGLRPRVSKGSS
jgi:hypothetical protein